MSETPKNDPVLVVLKKYLDALERVDGAKEALRAELQQASGAAAIQALFDKHGSSADLAEAAYQLAALKAWHADNSVNLVLWKLENPKP